MFQLIEKILLQFINCFKRTSTWKWFVVLIIGFMIRNKHNGITSIISELKLKPRIYHKMLHFFRSNAYTVEDLYKKWIEIVTNETNVMRITGRVLIIGDHIKISKEGRKMPDIQLLHQDSENSGKGEYIDGHMFAQVSTVISSGNTSRSVPLITELQKSPPKIPGTKKPDGDTLVIQMVKLAQKAARNIDEPTILALDAYFSKCTAFITASQQLMEDGKPYLSIVTRAQDSYKGFLPPEPPEKSGPGRPKTYGKEYKLKELFKDMSNFTEAKMVLYGKKTDAKYFCLDLIWKPVQKKIRFVLLSSERGRCILMSDDLTLTPEEIITIYTLRFKIETGFDEQKNDIGCFDYHFWTMALAKRKKFKANWEPNNEPDQEKIKSAKKAISSFICLGSIATGILTIIAFKHDCDIWKLYQGWVRTLRVRIPSVAIVRETLSYEIQGFLRQFPHMAVSRIIKPLLRDTEYLYADFDTNIEENIA